MVPATFDVACMGWELRLVYAHVHTGWYTFQVGPRALMGANRLLAGASQRTLASAYPDSHTDIIHWPNTKLSHKL